jgi:hypothetical protein
MPFRSARTLEGWLDEFLALGYPAAGELRVITQDGASGADTGLVSVQLTDADTSIYIQPAPDASDHWTVTLEARDEALSFDAPGLFRLAAELSSVSALCAFLQAKSRSSSGDTVA